MAGSSGDLQTQGGSRRGGRAVGYQRTPATQRYGRRTMLNSGDRLAGAGWLALAASTAVLLHTTLQQSATLANGTDVVRGVQAATHGTSMAALLRCISLLGGSEVTPPRLFSFALPPSACSPLTVAPVRATPPLAPLLPLTLDAQVTGLALLGVLFFCDQRLGKRLLTLVLLNVFVSALLKTLLHEPRPSWFSPDVVALVREPCPCG